MRADPDHPPDKGAARRYCADLDLARDISAGSIPAWHRFIDQYSRLMYDVLRRHLFAEDEDDVRTVHVDILEALFKGGLAKYRGDASLATWLVVYSRSRALDFVRRRYGRRRPPKWQKELGELDRAVLRLFFVERMPLEAVVHVLALSAHPSGAAEITKSILRIESVVDPVCLARLEDERRAKSLGLRNPRMIEWMMQLRLDFEERTDRSRPDVVLVEKEARETAERVRLALERLPRGDRAVAALRFEKGCTAAEISEELGLGGERRAYTIIGRIVRMLRRIVFAGEDGRP